MNRIAELRKDKKLNQKELGSVVGVAQNTVCNWENGKREPDYDSLKRMADFFDVSVDYLLGRTDKKETPPAGTGEGLDAMEQQLMKYVKDMTPDQKRLLLAQMQVMSEQSE